MGYMSNLYVLYTHIYTHMQQDSFYVMFTWS